MNRLLLLFFTSLTIWNAHAQLQIWEELDAANYEDTLFKSGDVPKYSYSYQDSINAGTEWFVEQDTLYRATDLDTTKYGGVPSDAFLNGFLYTSESNSDKVAFVFAQSFNIDDEKHHIFYFGFLKDSELKIYDQEQMGFDNNEPIASTFIDYVTSHNFFINNEHNIYFKLTKDINMMFSKIDEKFTRIDNFYESYSNDSSYIFYLKDSSIYTIMNKDTTFYHIKYRNRSIDITRISKDEYIIVSGKFMFKHDKNGFKEIYELEENSNRSYAIRSGEWYQLDNNLLFYRATHGGFLLIDGDKYYGYRYLSGCNSYYFTLGNPFPNYNNSLNISWGYIDECGNSILIADYDSISGLWVKEYDEFGYDNAQLHISSHQAAHHITKSGDTLTAIGILRYYDWNKRIFGLRLYINDSIVDYTSSHLKDITNLRITDDYLYVESGSGLWRTAIGNLYYSGKLFYDLNQDGVLDENEPAYSTPIKIHPSGITVYPSENGEFAFSGEYGETYTMTIPGDSLFDYTSVVLPYTFNRLDSNYIGVTVANPELSAATEVNLARARCITTNESELLVKNTGYGTIDKITIALIANERTYVSSDEMVSRSGDTLFFEVTDLEAQENYNIPLSTLWPSVNEVGEQLKFETITTVFQNNDVYSTTIDSTFALLRCSFDPNDKAVSPAGVSDERYTLKSSELTYKIRFENTGNDVAYHVTIYDTLTQDLDWTTFEVIGSSHPQITHIDDNGVVVFYFQDIMLPDSTTDKEGAQGYVTFKIKAKTDINDYTVIQNNAAIVFDSNKPIYTNTTSNTMVTSLPTVTSVNENILSVPADIVYNASNQTVSVTNKAITQLKIYNLSGKLVLDKKASSIDVASLPSGVYIVYGLSENGEIISTAKVVF